ncbi:MAG: SRPBCC family protein [Sandaracinaceae bacterium]
MKKLACLPLALLLVSATAAAQERPSVLEEPLRGLTARELRTLSPLLDRHVVGLVQHYRRSPFPASHFAAEVKAPPADVFALLSEASGFPAFMPALSEMTVVEENRASTALTWRWQTAVFSLEGQTTMTVYAPPPSQARRGYRIVFERTQGDLGRGREVWRIVPRGEGSLVTLSTRMDLSDGSYVARQMQGRSLSRAAAATFGLGMMLNVRAEAERRAGREPRTPLPGLIRPHLGNVRALDPIVRNGDLMIIDANEHEVGQVAFLSLHGWPEDQIRSILRHPVAFASALIGGSDAEVSSEHTDEGLRFDWEVHSALSGMGGEMTLSETPDGTLALEALDGTLEGGSWRFRTESLPNDEAMILGWARFDPASAHPLLGAIVDADPSFRAGLVASAHAALVRAMRVRLLRMPRGQVLPPP